MKRVIFLIVLLTASLIGSFSLAAEPGGQKEQVITGHYNAVLIYKGDYSSDALLFRNANSAVWQRLPRLGRLHQVTCQAAANALNREGRWQGRLKRDGSCGSDSEPQAWTTGNRLNYESALEDQQQKK